MAELKQLSSITFYQGWYGTCPETGDNECADFPLIEGELADAIKLYPEIKLIYEVKDGANGLISYNGDQEDGFPLHYGNTELRSCLLYTSPSPRDRTRSRMPSSA